MLSAKNSAVRIDGTSLLKIIHLKKADSLIRYAAEELQKYLFKATGIRLPVEEGTPEKGVFFLAEFQDCPEFGNHKEEPTGSEGFDHTLIFAHQSCLYLGGEHRTAVLYAVYDFLQEILDIRFFAPGEEHEYIPERKSVELCGNLCFHTSSAFQIRDFVNRTNRPEVLSFAVKNRINTILGCGPWLNGSEQCSPENADLIHSFGLKVRGPGHSWKHFIPEEKMFREHPEYFSLLNGKRTVNERTACFSNPEVRAIFRRNLRAYLREHPYWDIFAFWAEDVPDYHYCECEECRKMSATDWYILLVNESAEIVAEELPGTVFELIVYQGTAKPPEQIRKLYRDGENMLVNVCLGQTRDLFHPLSRKTFGSANVYATYAAWRNYLKEINYRGGIMLMEYYNLCEQPNSGPCGRTLLWPMDVIREDILFYRREGLHGLGAFTGFDILCWPTPFNLWSWIRLWNDPEQTTDRLKEDFYPKYFGSSGNGIRARMEQWNALMREPTSRQNLNELRKLPPMFSPGETESVPPPRIRLLELHRQYGLLLKELFLAFLERDLRTWTRRKSAYLAFFEQNRTDFEGQLAPFPPLWTQHFFHNIDLERDHPADRSAESFRMLR